MCSDRIVFLVLCDSVWFEESRKFFVICCVIVDVLMGWWLLLIFCRLMRIVCFRFMRLRLGWL